MAGIILWLLLQIQPPAPLVAVQVDRVLGPIPYIVIRTDSTRLTKYTVELTWTPVDGESYKEQYGIAQSDGMSYAYTVRHGPVVPMKSPTARVIYSEEVPVAYREFKEAAK